jgi:hypothetical protein
MDYSFNIEKIGTPIAKIKGGKYSKKEIRLEESNEDKVNNPFKNFEIQDGLFELLPNKSKDRNIGLIIGSEGSGKSYFVKNYLVHYRDMYPDNPIYVFSLLDTDETLDSVQKKTDFLRVKLDDSIYQQPFKIDDFKDSMVVFDDVDSITNNKLRKAVYDLLNNLIDIGRHFNVSILFTSHLPTNGKESRQILNSSHFITFFPYGLTRSTKYVLDNYYDIGDKELDEIKKLKSRWCVCTRHLPRMLLTEQSIKMID